MANAYQRIKSDLVSGRHPPGQMLFSADLAAAYGMSRTPINEALKLLCQERLIQVLPRVGYVVPAVTLADVAEVFQLRVVLEGLAAELAVERARPSDIHAFRAFLERSEAEPPIEPDEPDALVRSIERHDLYHVELAAMARNDRLVEMLRGLLDQTQRMLALDLSQRTAPTFGPIPGHLDVFDFIVAGDRAGARKAITEHLLVAQRRILDVLVPYVPDQTHVPAS